jgi:hypothetical protein
LSADVGRELLLLAATATPGVSDTATTTVADAQNARDTELLH